MNHREIELYQDRIIDSKGREHSFIDYLTSLFPQIRTELAIDKGLLYLVIEKPNYGNRGVLLPYIINYSEPQYMGIKEKSFYFPVMTYKHK